MSSVSTLSFNIAHASSIIKKKWLVYANMPDVIYFSFLFFYIFIFLFHFRIWCLSVFLFCNFFFEILSFCVHCEVTILGKSDGNRIFSVLVFICFLWFDADKFMLSLKSVKFNRVRQVSEKNYTNAEKYDKSWIIKWIKSKNKDE